MAAAESDWASLPSPLLCSVAERLIPIAYARLRAVCTSWSSAVSPEDWEVGQRQPYYLPRPPRCPWLMVYSEEDGPTGSVTFFSLPESLRPYRIPAHDLLHDKRIVGSQAGWLATVDAECNMRLINPLTRAQIPLPSFSTHPAVGVVRDGSTRSPVELLDYNILNIIQKPTSYEPELFRDTYIKKMFVSSSPSSSGGGDYVVAFIADLDQRLSYARAGDEAWSVLDDNGCMDAVFVDRILYAMAGNGEIRALDFSEPSKSVLPRMTAVTKWTCKTLSTFSHLVYSSGDLFQITRHRKLVDPITTLRFKVNKFDTTGKGKRSCVPIKELGDRSIFLGMNQSFCISTQDIPGLRPNCIYFIDDYWNSIFAEGEYHTPVVGVYDLTKETCDPIIST